MKTYIVIPTIRNLDILKSWTTELASCHLIIVEDHEDKEIKIPDIKCLGVQHYSRNDIKKEFGTDSWIFPQQSSAIRSFGFWKAYTQKADLIITFDDDCAPKTSGFVTKHQENIASTSSHSWMPTYPYRKYLYTRGFPYTNRGEIPTKLSHGLWTNVPDLDGMTQIMKFDEPVESLPDVLYPFPKGMYFPMSVMNLAFTSDVAVLLYQLLMGYNMRDGSYWGYERFDDIWSGIFMKKVFDHLGYAAVSGSPYVHHSRASNMFANLQKEARGIELNETLWKEVDAIKLKSDNPKDCYIEIAKKVSKINPYFKTTAKAMQIWADLF